MTDKIELLIFEVLTMGIPSDSFELELCLRKIAGLENGDNPIIVNAILRLIYADDVISSFDSEKKAIIFFKLIVKVFANYGFLLHKFASDSDMVMKFVPPESIDKGYDISVTDPEASLAEPVKKLKLLRKSWPST